MPILHALLTAIDRYPDPKNALRGCVNDVRHLDDYLKNYCESMGYAYRPLILLDEQVTRQAIIDGFGHFQAAEKQDVCLFHYSGHGARCPSPKEFWVLEADHNLESIVCWDSRLPGGFDLMDKELSYLVWRAARQTDLPFVTIADCCHSGDFRSEPEKAQDLKMEIVGARTPRDMGGALPADQFLGIEQYKRTESGQYSPPRGRRVHLAAARNTEYAKEVIARGQPRGIFTYCLIEALQSAGGLLTYADLLNRVNLRINNNVQEQSAQLGATFTEDRNLGFLFSPVDAERPAYLIAWDKNAACWMLNAGALHGMPEGDPDNRTTLELADDGRRVNVEKVLPNRSQISGMDGYDTKLVYVARVKKLAAPKLALVFAPGSDPEGVDLLSGLIQSRDAGLFRLVDSTPDDGYRIHAWDGAFFLSRAHDAMPLFQRVSGYDETAALSFIQNLARVAAWRHLLDLNNPCTGIQPREILLELYRVTEPGNDSDDAPAELTDWQAGPTVYSYGSAGQKPAFRLKLRNAGHRSLWVSMLYLGSNFSVTNQLLPKVLLEPEQEAWAEEIYKGHVYRTIPLRIDEAQLRQGITSVDEYIKILISTEELNTDVYFQKGLAADTTPTRLAGRQETPETRDWSAKTIWVRVVLGHFD